MTHRMRDQRGASLTEFAILAPVLFLLVFGIIDFGWMFAQHQDVRHGTREGARLAVVNYDTTSGGCSTVATQLDRLKCLVQERTTSLDDSDTTVEIGLATDVDGDGNADAGDTFAVRVCYPASSLSGFFNAVLSGRELRDTTHMRVEQSWAAGTTFDTLAC